MSAMRLRIKTGELKKKPKKIVQKKPKKKVQPKTTPRPSTENRAIQKKPKRIVKKK